VGASEVASEMAAVRDADPRHHLENRQRRFFDEYASRPHPKLMKERSGGHAGVDAKEPRQVRYGESRGGGKLRHRELAVQLLVHPLNRLVYAKVHCVTHA
jgi:hypothetical protein